LEGDITVNGKDIRQMGAEIKNRISVKKGAKVQLPDGSVIKK
jgi:hypothetical protein